MSCKFLIRGGHVFVETFVFEAIDGNQSVDISVIIPVRRLDDPDLSECLCSLRNQAFSGNFEILTVEGGNIAQARNEGIRISNGRYIAFIDSDCQAPESWLSTMLFEIKEINGSGGIGGVGVSRNNKDRFSRSLEIIFRSYLGSLGSASLHQPNRTKMVNSLSTSNSIYPADILRNVGGFDERYILNEDSELNARITSRGYKLYLNPKSFVYHKRPKGLSRYSKKFYSWGESRMRAMLTDKRLADLKIVTIFFLTMLVAFTFPIDITKALIPFYMYLILLFSHGLYYSIQKRDPLLILYLPTLYSVQHFSYWIGLLRGLFKGKYNDIKDSALFEVRCERLARVSEKNRHPEPCKRY